MFTVQLREFHAHPMPDLSFVDTLKKPTLDVTRPMPYNLRVDTRGQDKQKKINDKVGLVVLKWHLVPVAD